MTVLATRSMPPQVRLPRLLAGPRATASPACCEHELRYGPLPRCGERGGAARLIGIL